MSKSYGSRRSAALFGASLLFFILAATTTVSGQTEEFANAQWIAMEADSTILFPHVHLLKAKSEKGRSLKQYRLPVLQRQFYLDDGDCKSPQTAKKKKRRAHQAVVRAWANVCGMGQYELFINGEKMGRNFLDPGWTMYSKHLLYNTFDVTEQLSHSSILTPHSPVTLSVMLGGGMYDIPLKGYHKMGGSCGAPKLLLALHIEYANGKRQTIVTDSAWTACESPVTYSSIYAGETYDATIVGEASKLCNVVGEASKLYPTPSTPVVLTRPHWDVPLVKQDDRTRLVIKKELPMTLISSLPSSGSTAAADSSKTTDRRDSGNRSSLLYDMGQNCSGIVRLTVRGKRGSKVTLRPSEILRDGTVYQRCMPGYAWTYTLHGPEPSPITHHPSPITHHPTPITHHPTPTTETWQPQFSYTGFRYVEVQADEGVEIVALTGLHTSANVAETGHFECSDTLLNRIYTLIDWAISSNLASITTDCPTREKLGWQEQNHLMAYSMMYRYDMQALMNKIADDLADSQHPDGSTPTIAPEYTQFDKGSGFEDTPEWGASFILCPYYTYLWYGDDTAMRRHYDAMKRYIDYLESRTNDHILDYGLGDWYDIGPERPGFAQLTSVALSATAMYYYELCTMSRIANHLAEDANSSLITHHLSLRSDAQRFEAMAAKVKQAFNERFWNKEQQQYERGSQTASAMALFMGLTTDENRHQVLQKLVGDITTRMGLAGNTSKRCSSDQPATSDEPKAIVTAGDVGYRYVLQALREGGRNDVIWQMNRYDDIPGYAYQLRQGATALTESWQAYDNVSNNHLMLGHLMEWLFQAPGGIRQADNSVAWRHIIIEPQMLGTLTWAKTSYHSPHGLITCNWTALPDHTHWTVDITIPEGTDAEVRLPDGTRKRVEAGHHHFNNKS